MSKKKNKKEGMADKIKRLSFYNVSFSILHIMLEEFDEDVRASKRAKKYNILEIRERHVNEKTFDIIIKTLKSILATMIIDVSEDIIINSEITFSTKIEKDILEDSKIIEAVFIDYIDFRLKD